MRKVAAIALNDMIKLMPKVPEQELIKIAAQTAKDAKIAFLMLPGVGTKDDIREAAERTLSYEIIAGANVAYDMALILYILQVSLHRRVQLLGR